MRYSKLFGKTVREAAKEAQTISHKLLYQAGYIRESTSGRYYFLPLGMRVVNKIINIVRTEMDKSGAQEMLTPVLHPLEFWKETNRTSQTGFELTIVTDRRGAKFALGGTAEEMMVDVVRKFQETYKDLPFNIYQFSQKFRDELRARGGLLRVREFMMKDAYSFHATEEDFKREYQNMKQTYTKIFNLLGLKTVIVESDNGYIGGEYCHEFIVDSQSGESKYLITEDSSFAAHEDIAQFIKDNKNVSEEALPLQEVEAVRGTTMEDGVDLHKKPLWQQIKDVLYVDQTGRFILAIIRGDFDVNEIKLKRATNAVELRMATDDEVRINLGSEPGFISPVNISKNFKLGTKLIIVADDSLNTIKNAYGGANAKHRDLLNININRDYTPDKIADIALAKEGYLSKSGKRLIAKKGIEVGNIFQLGHHYTNLMKNAVFTDKDGKLKKYYMGCYGIGIARTLAAVVEKHNDSKGITWPKSITPYDVYLISIGNDKSVLKHADEVYQQLEKQEISVLYDDRESARPGEKFSDFELIGIPVRLVISAKTGDKVEVKKRTESTQSTLEVDQLRHLGYFNPQTLDV